jgi:hypothetical protein
VRQRDLRGVPDLRPRWRMHTCTRRDGLPHVRRRRGLLRRGRLRGGPQRRPGVQALRRLRRVPAVPHRRLRGRRGPERRLVPELHQPRPAPEPPPPALRLPGSHLRHVPLPCRRARGPARPPAPPPLARPRRQDRRARSHCKIAGERERRHRPAPRRGRAKGFEIEA